MKPNYFIVNENKGLVLGKKNKWLHINSISTGNKTGLRVFQSSVDAQQALVMLPAHGNLSVYSTEKAWSVYGVNLQNPGKPFKQPVQPVNQAHTTDCDYSKPASSPVPVPTTPKEVYSRGGEVESNNAKMTLQTPLIMGSVKLLDDLTRLRAQWDDVVQNSVTELRRVDSALQDAMHLVEFNSDLTEDESYNLMFNIRALRIERRRIKNEQAVAQKMKEVFDCLSDQELGSALLFVQNMKSRSYQPRSEFYDGLAKSIRHDMEDMKIG